jgi:hypothetical protein
MRKSIIAAVVLPLIIAVVFIAAMCSPTTTYTSGAHAGYCNASVMGDRYCTGR